MNLNKLTIDQIKNGLLGTIFADGCISKKKGRYKNAYLEITHTSKNLDYIKFKKALLEKIGIKSTISEHNKKTENRSYSLFRLYAYTNKWFTELRQNIYNNSRTKLFPKKYIDTFNLLSILLLYLDDGTLRMRYYEGTDKVREMRVTLCLDSFTLDELFYFKAWLFKTYGVETKYYRHTKSQDLNRGFRLWMNTINTKKFMNIIKEFYNVIPSMNYKFIQYYLS